MDRTSNQAFDPRAPKTSISTPIGGACRNLKLSQGMVELRSVMSIYKVETLLASHFVFNNGNRQKELISDPKGCSEPPKQAYQHWLTECHDVKSSQSMVELHSIISIYNVETMLGSHFIFNMATRTMDWYLTQKGAQTPKNKHIYTNWRPVVTWNRARARTNCILLCLYLM